MDSTKSKHKICVSTVYRDTSKSIEKFIWHHDSIGCDLILVIDTTDSMSEKMSQYKFSTSKIMFVPLTVTESAMTDQHIVNSVILPHCKKHNMDWLLHLSIDERVDFNGNFGDIHSFLKCKPESDGIVILKVRPNCSCKGESRCITRVKYTASYDCEWKWKYCIKNPTVIRASTNEMYRYGEYDRYQSVIRSKNGKSAELVQLLHCSYIDTKSKSWTSYLKSFIVSDSNSEDEQHDKDCTLYRNDDHQDTSTV